LTSPYDRRKALKILDEGMANNARVNEMVRLLSVGLTTLQSSRMQISGDGDGVDRRKGNHRHTAHRLREKELQRILLTCKKLEFAALPPGQIVPVLANRWPYIGSECSFYRVLHAHWQVHRRVRDRHPQEPRSGQRLRATGPNQVWSWDITYLPTTMRGIWLYLGLMMDVWSWKVVAWDVAEREGPAIAVDQVGRVCLKERMSEGWKQPLVQRTDNAMSAATLESRMEELGVLRSFSRPRVSNKDPFPVFSCSEQRKTNLITRADHSPAKTRRISEWRR
jgi:hypothetical protein